MGLSVGIVGLPNVGKSTLFNALMKKQLAFAANFPFATIEPNIGIVPVPDTRLGKLAKVIKESEGLGSLPPEIPSTVKFVDIAGLIKGAHKGEGLGNKFLSHIREVSVICHVLRDFSDPDVIKDAPENPLADIETVETELILADLETLEKQGKKLHDPTVNKKFKSAVEKLTKELGEGCAARKVKLDDQEEEACRQLSLLTAKPIIVVLNVDEDELSGSQMIGSRFAKQSGITAKQVVAICAKLEEQLASLTESERREYLKSLGVAQDGLARLIERAYSTLGLINFLTAGEKEVRAWTIDRGTLAPNAAGVIHTDFIKGFIKAEVVEYDDFVKESGWKGVREKGLVRLEGKEYIVKEGDVIDFKINS